MRRDWTHAENMRVYLVESSSGDPYGLWPGHTAAEALAALHSHAGYDVSAEGDELVFADEGDRAICGDLTTWRVREAADGAVVQIHGDGTLWDWRVTLKRRELFGQRRSRWECVVAAMEALADEAARGNASFWIR